MLSPVPVPKKMIFGLLGSMAIDPPAVLMSVLVPCCSTLVPMAATPVACVVPAAAMVMAGGAEKPAPLFVTYTPVTAALMVAVARAKLALPWVVKAAPPLLLLLTPGVIQTSGSVV